MGDMAVPHWRGITPEACLSKVLLKSLKEVSSPKSTSLFSVTSDQFLLKRFAIKTFIISNSYFRVFYLVFLAFKVFNNKELWEMIGDRSGYVTRGTFILVAVYNYVVNKCCFSACYSSRKFYLWHKFMREYCFKELIDACCFWIINLNWSHQLIRGTFFSLNFI